MKHFILIIFITFCLSVYKTTAQEHIIVQVDSLLKRKNYNEAKQLLITQINTNKSDDLIEKLGDVYGLEENWDKAIEYYKMLVKSNPKSANYNYKLGGVLGMKALSVNKFKALGLISDVKYHFTLAANLNKEHIDVRWALIELYLQLPGILGGSIKKAKEYASELESQSPIEGYLAKAYIADYTNNNKEHKKWSLKAINLAENISSTYPRVNIHYQLGKIASTYNVALNTGLKHLTWFVKRHNQSNNIKVEWAYYHIAKIYLLKNQQDKAKTYIAKALKVNPDFNEAIKLKKKYL